MDVLFALDHHDFGAMTLPISLFAVGILIGGIGVGGVLLVPLLSGVGLLSPYDAVRVAMLSFIFTGIIGSCLFARRGSLPIRPQIPMLAGAMLGAAVGSLLLKVISGTLLGLANGVLLCLASVLTWAFSQRDDSVVVARQFGPSASLLIGAGVGTVSAITGTGGPFVLVPLLLVCSVPLLAAIGAGQLVQVPLASIATAVNVAGDAHLPPATFEVVAIVAAGCLVGAWGVQRLPQRGLARIVAPLLGILGGIIVWGALVRLWASV